MNRKQLAWAGVLAAGIAAIVLVIGSSVDSPFGSGGLDERQQTLYALIDDIHRQTATAGGVLRQTVEFEETATVQARTLHCADFPQYCVPLAGGEALAGNESAETRTLDEASHGAAGVVRGFTDDRAPFIGRADAPVQFVLVTDFACSTCRTYHADVFQQALADFVLTGQAAVRLVFTGEAASQTAAQAALCAGEQGGLWEMVDALFRVPSMSFAPTDIEAAANEIGLDGNAVLRCVESGRYADLPPQYAAFAAAQDVPGAPTVLALEAGGWQIVRRDIESLRAWIESHPGSE